MNLKFFIPAALLSLLTATSCSSIKNITGHNNTAVTQTKTEKSKKNGKSRGKRKKVNTGTPANTTTNISAQAKIFTSTDSISIAKQLAGEWTFDKVAAITVTGEEDRPSLTFEEGTQRFYASNGCNFYNGSIRIGGFNKLSFENIISTSNFCQDIPWADYITAMWNIASNFYITHRGAEEYLDIKDDKDRTLATLKRHQLSSLNGMWNIVEINGRSVTGEVPTIVIDLPEKTVHGNTGCNLFNGTIFQDPDTDRSVQFQDMAVTCMACPNTAVETAFLVALEQVEKARIENEDQAILTDRNGNTLLILQRSTL